MAIQTLTLNVNAQPSAEDRAFLYLSQNENGRDIRFRVLGDDLPSGCTATLSGVKPDGNVWSKAGTVTNNFVVVEEDIQMTAVAGRWDAQLDIVNGSKNIVTALIRITVGAAAVEAGAVPSDTQLKGYVEQCKQYAETAKDEAYGSPLTATTAAGMTDQGRVYVYTGSETGYTSGHWYYWDGTAWTDGGVYNAVAVDTDTTLSISGKAADAKKTGDEIGELKSGLSASEVMINLANGRVKNVPIERSGAIGNLSVSYSYGRVTLNGSVSSNIVLEADSDRITEDLNYIAYRQGITSGLIEDNTGCRKNPFTPGRYRLVFRMLSGTVTKNGVTYTSNEDFGTTNVVNAFLLKADATTLSYTLIKTNVTKEADLSVNEVGLQLLYIYNRCAFDNAVFELYLEKVEEEPIADGIPTYWNAEVTRGIEQARSNIESASMASTTVCFVTDCHWAANEKHSPAIAKKLMEECNINYFVNGGDIIEGHYSDSKQSAIDELWECINAFRVCPKPMITLYGNHDRNRNGNSEAPETFLTAAEHANIVFKSFMPDPNIIRVTSDYSGFYWEDDTYRYVGIYWYSSETHAFPYAEELCNTDKPVIIFCHGIYYSLGANIADDVMDNAWILNAFEPYKAKIKCFIQGHTHRDGLRHAWGTVPIIVIDCDKATSSISTIGTITEQSVSIITFDTDKISVVKVGRGEDFTVTAESADWRQEYTGGTT